MTAVFSEKEKKDAFKTKRTMWIVWGVCCVVAIGSIVAMGIIDGYLISSLRNRDAHMPLMIASMAVAVVFGCGSIFFFDIKFRLTSKYCKMLKNMKEGRKEHSHGKFICLNRDIETKDGVFFYTILLDCPPMKRGDITERKILVERNHSLPAFEEGDNIKFITHANILLAYEVDNSPEKPLPYVEPIDETPDEVTTADNANNN